MPVLAAGLVAFVVLPAKGQLQVGEYFPATIDTPIDYAGVAEPDRPELRWTHTLSHPGATYIALHFEDFDLAPGDWLEVADADGGQAYVMQGRGKMQAGTFWARHIKGETAVMTLYVASAEGGRGLIIDQYAAGLPEFLTVEEPQAICGTDDRENAVCYKDSHPVEYDKCRTVARMLLNGGARCTGSLVSADNLFLTNNHCITSPEDALNSDFDFMAEAPTCETPNCPTCFPGVVFSGSTLLTANMGYDYSLVKIEEGDPASRFGYLELDNRPPIVGEQIYNAQHSGGYAKMIAIYSTHPTDTGGLARISSINEPTCQASTGIEEVGYFLDGFGGSSGSPIIASSSHKMIALHHCTGCPNRGVATHKFYDEVIPFINGTPSFGGIAPGAITITADSSAAGESPERAIDRAVASGWRSGEGTGPHWLRLDLGQTAPVTGFKLWHHSATGGSPALSTRAFEIQMAPSAGGPWNSVITGSNPGQSASTMLSLDGLAAMRHVRVLITDPGADGVARIAELEIFAGATMFKDVPRGTNVAPQSIAVQASSQYDGSLGGDKAVDGLMSLSSRWVSGPTSPPHTLTLDLGSVRTLSGFIFHQAGNVESSGYNANVMHFQTARSFGGPWHSDALVISSSAELAAARTFVSPKDVRFVRLSIADPGPNSDPYARVPEFQIIEYTGGMQASFAATPTTGGPPLTVQFTDFSYGGPTSWSWTFGDGRTSTARHPVHTYTSVGTYSVTLMVKGPGGSDVLTRTACITVDDSVTPPVTVRSDFDHDGDVDHADVGHLQACLSGPGIAQNDPACLDARLDLDDDVDQYDFTILQACLSGAGIPVNPDCEP